ncbi:Major facilitator superfamily domain, general substrate transporter [Penicillium expansum]|uniref:Major facilitator superfamily domain, general substrate transporter n=1 Tax=Penicillium expansum TaxID=27334 RepID=A0A0A2JA64_PENEN|nr:Major facilitator superfamily domain, general substrate transporter [Penicillium expansum]KGO43256.1 Major facilitator superfamily domain, general substrate transporter [Penicillium expansum]KGO52312.1 Major facilitator superfamily domain, general substrate transporter [Penicillium expansum]KGO56492.1 Major facilitator superfamily domain, general substrate transporter [Penicillium expansum]
MDRLISILQFDSIGPLQPKSSKLTIALLVSTCCVFAVTTGYDAGLMNGVNMMPQYVDWFQLTTVTKSLSTCSSYIGWFIAALLMGPVVERTGRKGGIFISIILKLIGIALMASSQSVGMFIGGRIILGWAKGTAAIASSTEILNAMRQEQDSGQTLSYVEIVRTSNSRKRLILVTIILNSWSLVCAMSGTFLTDKVGRKTLCLMACIMMTITMFLIGVLTKFFGDGADIPGVYATIAMIFIFQGSYSFGIAPITQLYPPEVLNYSIRANGMAAWTLVVNFSGLLSTLALPIALAAIGWKMYIINGVWDALQALFVALVWIETKGLSLEDIDRVIDGNPPLNGLDPEGDYEKNDRKGPDLITEHVAQKKTDVKQSF